MWREVQQTNYHDKKVRISCCQSTTKKGRVKNTGYMHTTTWDVCNSLFACTHAASSFSSHQTPSDQNRKHLTKTYIVRRVPAVVVIIPVPVVQVTTCVGTQSTVIGIRTFIHTGGVACVGIVGAVVVATIVVAVRGVTGSVRINVNIVLSFRATTTPSVTIIHVVFLKEG